MPYRFKNNAFITLREAAEAVGYTYSHMSAMCYPGNSHYDPHLRTLRIEVDETWQQVFGPIRSKYVFRYSDIMRWSRQRQEQPGVRTYNASRGIIIE